MSLILQNPLSNSTHRIKLYFPNTSHFNPAKSLRFPIIHSPFPSLQSNSKFPFHENLYFSQNPHFHIKAYDSSLIPFEERERKPSKLLAFDAFLTAVESFCVVSSLVISVCCIVNWVWFRQQNNSLLVLLGNKVLVWLLAGAVAAGSVIRRRQWSRVCGLPAMKAKPGFESGNVIERIERLEESMKNASTLIRMLSRQLEKLGIRFRVTRKAMKEPISEAAALAQKNSEATRALAAQEVILEKELAEIQKVLLAMQDQQQKQVELILAIAKSANLFDSKRAPSRGAGMKPTIPPVVQEQSSGQQNEAVVGQKGSTNNKIVGS